MSGRSGFVADGQRRLREALADLPPERRRIEVDRLRDEAATVGPEPRLIALLPSGGRRWWRERLPQRRLDECLYLAGPRRRPEE